MNKVIKDFFDDACQSLNDIKEQSILIEKTLGIVGSEFDLYTLGFLGISTDHFRIELIRIHGAITFVVSSELTEKSLFLNSRSKIVEIGERIFLIANNKELLIKELKNIKRENILTRGMTTSFE
ncbi:MAG: hypothetical protein WC942_05360 [Clostridia bacterium]|jgi:hypothetical protein